MCFVEQDILVVVARGEVADDETILLHEEQSVFPHTTLAREGLKLSL